MNQPTFHPGPEQPSPEQRLLLLDDTKWESFIEQCARQLMAEGYYSQVIRMGGAGDKGRDVCGYSGPPIEDTWDLYQAKYYADALSPSSFAPELAKFLSCVFAKDYTRPRNYFICALKVGPTLHDLVLNPEKFKAWTLDQCKKGNFGAVTPELETFISDFPFGIFRVKTSADLLEIHSRCSDKHWEVFGVLAQRGPNPDMPVTPDTDEHRYVRALLDVYQEASSHSIAEPASIPAKYKDHFKAQRMLFYSAEGLNRFSRDKLPGAFDQLVNDVAVGIGSDLAYPHSDGLARLTKVLDAADSLHVTANPLNARLQAGDLKGACHHLANQGRATWVDNDE